MDGGIGEVGRYAHTFLIMIDVLYIICLFDVFLPETSIYLSHHHNQPPQKNIYAHVVRKPLQNESPSRLSPKIQKFEFEVFLFSRREIFVLTNE